MGNVKKRDAFIGRLAKHIDKIIIGTSYIILLVFILATASSIRVEEKMIERGIWTEYRRIGNSYFTVMYSLNTGDNKPAIMSPSGDELLVVDGWESTVTVDNSSRSFWDHIYRNVSGGDEILHNMVWDNYQLRQTTRLHDNLLTMTYDFLHGNENGSNLQLDILHRYTKFTTVVIDNQTIHDASVENENTIYRLEISLSPKLTAENLPYWSIENSAGRFKLRLELENIAADYNWTTVGEISMSCEKMQK